MKLTPLDIHHKEFRRSLRGYDESEVDNFLDEVADDFERLFKENIELSEKLDGATEQLRRYQVNEQTIQNTMLAAQRSAEDIVGKANADADQVLRDAELKAKEIIHNALQQKQQVAGELTRIKAAEEDFRTRFKSMLDAAASQVNEVALPEDVQGMVGGEPSVEPEVAAFGAAAARSSRLRGFSRAGRLRRRARARVVGAGRGGRRAGGRQRSRIREPLGGGRVRAARRGRGCRHRSRGRARRADRVPVAVTGQPGRARRRHRHRGDRLAFVARLAIRVTPKASRPGIAGWRDAELQVRVSAPPEDGKANAEACAAVAKAVGVPKSRVTVVKGQAARHKELEVVGVTDEQLFAALGRPDTVGEGDR